MKNRRNLIFLVSLLACPVLAAPVHVEVDTGRTQEHGAGISVGRGGECFVVVPLHVVEYGRTIVITDRGGRSAKAVRYQEPDGVDAALLKVDSGHTLDCPEDWDDGTAGQTAIQEADFMISKKVKQRGMQQRRFFLGGETSTTLSLQPFSASEADRLVEGDSGSSLYAKNRLVGMVVSVDTASGAGTALKQTQLHALFGNLVLAQNIERALVNPVLDRRAENRYATIGLRDFIDARTSFDVVTLDSQTAAANLQNQRRGIAPTYSDDLDYIVSASIIENRARNEQNPNYKASAAKESNFGKQLLNSIGGRSARYIYVANIDVEVQILKPKESREFTHIAKLEYKVPLTENVDQQELRNELPARAAVDALHETMLKYNLPVTLEEEKTEEEEDNSLLNRLFKK